MSSSIHNHTEACGLGSNTNPARGLGYKQTNSNSNPNSSNSLKQSVETEDINKASSVDQGLGNNQRVEQNVGQQPSDTRYVSFENPTLNQGNDPPQPDIQDGSSASPALISQGYETSSLNDTQSSAAFALCVPATSSGSFTQSAREGEDRSNNLLDEGPSSPPPGSPRPVSESTSTIPYEDVMELFSLSAGSSESFVLSAAPQDDRPDMTNSAQAIPPAPIVVDTGVSEHVAPDTDSQSDSSSSPEEAPGIPSPISPEEVYFPTPHIDPAPQRVFTSLWHDQAVAPRQAQAQANQATPAHPPRAPSPPYVPAPRPFHQIISPWAAAIAAKQRERAAAATAAEAPPPQRELVSPWHDQLVAIRQARAEAAAPPQPTPLAPWAPGACPIPASEPIGSEQETKTSTGAEELPVEHNLLGAPNSALTKSELQAKRRVNRRKNRQERKAALARVGAPRVAR